MGFLSFFLAISILVFHSNPLFGSYLISTNIAVNLFFVITGFYISLVLNEKYVKKNNSYELFITNRLLRIFPLYWIILFLTLLSSLILYFAGQKNNIITLELIPLLQKDFFSILNYLGKNLTLLITWDYFKVQFPYFLAGPQFWFIQIELMFYLIAPFIVRKNIIFIILLTFLSAAMNISPNQLLFFLDAQSITYLFLKVLIYFCLGILIYKAYKKYSFLKILTKTNGTERIFGKLAYPVFISHIFFIKILDHFMKRNSYFTLMAIVMTTAGSYFLLKMIDEPINHWRQKRLKKV